MTKKIITIHVFVYILISCRGIEIKPSNDSIRNRQTYDIWSGLIPSSLSKDHSTEMDASWKIMNETREKIQNFRTEKTVVSNTNTVLYPFSGIDVLNLFSFFPETNRYVLFGLEDPGYPFDWDSKSDSDKKVILSGIRNLSSHLAGRNYFTYRKMKEETKKPALSGAYPVFVAFLKRLGKEILDTREETITSGVGTWKGFTIEFYDPSLKKIQTLTYWKIFLTGNEGEPGDGIYEYFTSLGKIAIFTKSAEYLFHGEKRARFRDLLLQKASLIVQDDSGFPLRLFPASDWNKSLYGQYIKSWNLSGAVKPEEQKEILELSLGQQEPLPFPFGYGVLGGKDKKQSVLFVIQRK